MKESELPDHIGGYQHIVDCPMQDGDVWVVDGKPQFVVDEDWFGKPAPAKVSQFAVYRKIAPMRQGTS